MSVAFSDGPSPWFEVGSNILDAAAFVLVTTDLFGKERLRKFHENIVSKLKSKNIVPFYKFPFRTNAITYKEPGRSAGWRDLSILVLAVLFAMSLVFSGIAALGFLLDWIIRGWGDALKFFSQEIIDALKLLAFFWALPVALMLAPILAVCLLRFMLWLLVAVQLEGAMVVGGTIIFLLTRLITAAVYWAEATHHH